MCDFSSVRVVVLGQDPYINDNQAHGCAFSVRPGVQIPPSLLNIYKELEQSVPGFTRPRHGYLKNWCTQGTKLTTKSTERTRAWVGSTRVAHGRGSGPCTERTRVWVGSTCTERARARAHNERGLGSGAHMAHGRGSGPC